MCSIYRQAQEVAYEALHEGCAFMVLRAPLLDYFGVHVPALNLDCENIDQVIEASRCHVVAGLAGPSRALRSRRSYRIYIVRAA